MLLFNKYSMNESPLKENNSISLVQSTKKLKIENQRLKSILNDLSPEIYKDINN